MNASLKILRAGPLASVQDSGRPNYMRYGVSPSGVMDRGSFTLGNTALGNVESNPAIEVSLGGLVLKCTAGSVSVAVVGGEFNIKLNEQPLSNWSMFPLKTGDTLSVTPGHSGSWCYICFSAQLNSESWLGSQSVHLNSGVCGRTIAANDNIELDNCTSTVASVVSLSKPDTVNKKQAMVIRAVVGPQDRFFETETIESLFQKTLKVSNEYDRMGMRLTGLTLPIKTELNMPSEPITRGSIQVPGHGDPICLMADHQSAGGYPKIATVISADLDTLAQCRTGDELRFKQVSVSEAIRAARENHAASKQTRTQIMLNTSLIESRLWRSNLISGVESGSNDV